MSSALDDRNTTAGPELRARAAGRALDRQWAAYLDAAVRADAWAVASAADHQLALSDVQAAVRAAADEHPDLREQYGEFRAARHRSDQAVSDTEASSRSDRWATAGALAGGLGVLTLLALLVLAGCKAFGQLVAVPVWPFAAGGPALLVAAAVLFAWWDGQQPVRTTAATTGAQSAEATTLSAERTETALIDQIRSLLIVPAIDRLANPSFARPDQDVVELTQAFGMSARATPANRIQTDAYRRALMSLRKAGGATIGLAGIRGAGKSELLRSFCGDDADPASIERGGTIGVTVSAPVVYDQREFLLLILRRLLERVPGCDDPGPEQSGRTWSSADSVALLLVLGCTSGALIMLGAFMGRYRHLSAIALLVLAGLIVGGWVAGRARSVLAARRRLLRSRFGRGERVPTAQLLTSEARTRTGARATELMRQVQYVETRTRNTGVSASLGSFGGLSSSEGVSVSRADLTPGRLIGVLEQLVADLFSVGYTVVIGIDELDKLSDGDEAARFLNGIKVLFEIRECSFVLTVSDNAFAQFARRGLPVRDVFDSSLDDVVWVGPLRYAESRRLAASRLAGSGRQARPDGAAETLTDLQVLVCHCLAGGLPRDFLRAVRQLGQLRARSAPRPSMAALAPLLVAEQVRVVCDGVRSALRGRSDGDSASRLLAELDIVAALGLGPRTADILAEFLRTDPDFAALCGGQLCLHPVDTQVSCSEAWLRDTRRQLYTFLYFARTVLDGLSSPVLDDPVAHRDRIVARFEALADARSRLEHDAAAGWRAVSQVRTALELAVLVAPVVQPV